MVSVAQLVRAPDCGSGGRRFEPGHSPCKRFNPVIRVEPLLFFTLFPAYNTLYGTRGAVKQKKQETLIPCLRMRNPLQTLFLKATTRVRRASR